MKPISDENRGVPDVCCSYIPWHWKHIGIWFVLVLSWGPSISSQRVQEVSYSSVPNRKSCLYKHKCDLTLLPLGLAEPTSQWANFPSHFFSYQKQRATKMIKGTVWWSLYEMSPSHCILRYQDLTDLRKVHQFKIRYTVTQWWLPPHCVLQCFWNIFLVRTLKYTSKTL